MTEDGLPRKGHWGATYYAGEGKGKKGCKAHKKYRRAMLNLVSASFPVEVDGTVCVCICNISLHRTHFYSTSAYQRTLQSIVQRDYAILILYKLIIFLNLRYVQLSSALDALFNAYLCVSQVFLDEEEIKEEGDHDNESADILAVISGDDGDTRKGDTAQSLIAQHHLAERTKGESVGTAFMKANISKFPRCSKISVGQCISHTVCDCTGYFVLKYLNSDGLLKRCTLLFRRCMAQLPKLQRRGTPQDCACQSSSKCTKEAWAKEIIVFVAEETIVTMSTLSDDNRSRTVIVGKKMVVENR